jgi:hypothetical protein
VLSSAITSEVLKDITPAAVIINIINATPTKAAFLAHANKVRTTRKGDTEYTYTDHFEVYRDVRAQFNRIPADASEKMPDKEMDMLEPYNYEDIENFAMPYLSGYLSERFNYTAGEMEERESAENKLSDGDYYKGCKKYIQGIERQLNTSIVSKMTYYMPVKLGISAVIAIVAVLAMMSSAKAKMTVSSTEYTKNHNYDVADRRDIFINTTVTTRHIAAQCTHSLTVSHIIHTIP